MSELRECTVKSARMSIPIPKPIILRNQDKTKVRCYRSNDRVNSIPCEMHRLNSIGYTHVVNMPGDILRVLHYAKRLRLVVLDQRIVKFIAETGGVTVKNKKQTTDI